MCYTYAWSARRETAAEATDRTALNLHFLGDTGRSILGDSLTSGHYRVRVPEEGALLVATWLLNHGEAERAADLVDTLLPFFDRLRFYPISCPRPLQADGNLCVQTVGDVVTSLRARQPKPAVERMKESVQVWTPQYDRAVALFLETVEGDPPAVRKTDSGELVRAANGQPIVDGGWPCRHYPAGWQGRACQLLDDYEQARQQYGRWGKAEKPKENFARLRSYLAVAAEDPGALSGRDVGMIRHILGSYISRRGAPDSQRLRDTRAAQARTASRPSHHLLARLVAQRLEAYPADEGVADPSHVLGGLSAEEASRLGTAPGEPMPPSVVAKAMRCLAAPIETLVERGLVASGEVLGSVLPSLTAQTRASAIDDPALRRVYQSVYVAFRRRRSLLLLDLASQVKLDELPWIAAIEPWVGTDAATREAARRTLEHVARLATEAFPHSILPNTLVRELRSLARSAELTLPLVDELAADIFMGAFSANFLHAAKVAGHLLAGTLYERYYGIPYEHVLRLDDVEPARSGTPTSLGFARLCEGLAGADRVQPSVARNGTIIEQAQIVTTHNLAVLFDTLGLADVLRLPLPDLARRCFAWICRQLRPRRDAWRAELHVVKNSAYAWRQMVFFLALLDATEVATFLDWADAHLTTQRPEVGDRLCPAVAGLRAVAAGDRLDAAGHHLPSGGRRFVGWTTERHWLQSH